VGNPGNAGLTVLYEAILNGVTIASVTIAADVTASASDNVPSVPVVPDDALRIRATPSAPLPNLITNARGSVQ